MKKNVVLVFAVLFILAACQSTQENPGKGPTLTVVIPELFSPDPDAHDKMAISITVEHPVAIKDWHIQIQPNRGRSQQRQNAEPAPAQDTQTERRETRRIFYEHNGRGHVPEKWEWNGKGNNGEMVQSAMEYRFTLSVNDIFDNSTTYEGIINTDVLVRREGNTLRIVVPSIIFQGNSDNFINVYQDEITEEIVRSNRRILTLIARALNRFDGYKITVEGHTNPGAALGTAARNTENTRNQPISLARANAVINYLVSNHNIDRTRLTASGMSATRTVTEAFNNEDENWKNRRVEFILQR